MSSDGQERNQKPSERRMKEVRRKGSLGRSQDLSAWVGLGAAAIMLPTVGARAREAATSGFAAVRQAATAQAAEGVDVAVRALTDGLRGAALAMLPMLLVAAAATTVVAVAQGGVHVRSLKPRGDAFNPATAVKRLFGAQAWWQGAKVLAKTAAVALAMLVTVRGLLPALMGGARLPLSHLLDVAGGGVSSLLRAGILAGVALALVDLAVVLRRNRKQTRMTLREVKEDHKQTEGDPQVKAAIRSRQLAMTRNRMMAAVADADVVLVNPTHVAVALRYEPGKGAPRVVAKGAGAVAAAIRKRAAEHNVPLVEDVPLARALHAACEVGAEIPEYLFTAVARVLAFVMALRRRGASAGQHHLPGGSTLPAGETTDHRAAGRVAKRASARAVAAARAARRSPGSSASPALPPSSSPSPQEAS